MGMRFFEAVKNRRSIYDINNETLLSDDNIIKLIEEAIVNTPSPFNSQSARVVLLVEKEHKKFWQMLKDEMSTFLAIEKFASLEEKINKSFASGYGTILFFEDLKTVGDLQQNMPDYKYNFPIWSEQSNGMLQFVIWTALQMYGFGSSLQHYNSLIDDKIKETWQLPMEWQLIAQMPFGKKIAAAPKKQVLPVSDRFKFFK